MKKRLYIGVICALVLTMCASAFYLIRYALEGMREAELYNELAAQTTTAATAAPETPTASAAEPTAAQPTQPEETAERNTKILDIYKNLHDDPETGNSDMVGWISIEGTKLNYPVLQSKPENEKYYLYRNFEKANSVRGSIYAWELGDVFEPSDNITLFGHNMKDGSMFACLNEYTDKAHWEQNSLITFNTIYEYHTYKIFAVFKVNAAGEYFTYHKFVNAADEAEFDAFVKKCRDLSFYDTGIIPAYGDKIICLSTCEYTLENGRLVVAAVQIS